MAGTLVPQNGPDVPNRLRSGGLLEHVKLEELLRLAAAVVCVDHGVP
jgi:hypothetical protein